MDRREFLKLLYGSTGGIILAGTFGCGSSSNYGPGIWPNGYRFYRIKNTGDMLGSGARSLVINGFQGSAHISDNGLLTFDARDTQDRTGIFQLAVDFAGDRPRVEWERCALLVGETLADGREVANYKAMDVNNVGNIAAVIGAGPGDYKQHYGSALYLDVEKNGFEPLLNYGHPLHETSLTSSGIFGDVDLHDDNDILVVTNYMSRVGEVPPGEGVFYLPQASRENMQIMMATGDIMPATDHQLTAFGLVDLHGQGHFVVQGQATPLSTSQVSTSQDMFAGSSLLLTGNLDTPLEQQILAATSDLSVGTHVGISDYGPRATSQGEVYSIVQDENDHLILTRGDQILLQTGDASPAGGRIVTMMPGAVDKDGLLYYTLLSENRTGLNLMVFNGQEHGVLLSRGDFLADGGSPVEEIYFGTTTKHVDDQGRLVFLCSFADGSVSLVVGIPI